MSRVHRRPTLPSRLLAIAAGGALLTGAAACAPEDEGGPSAGGSAGTCAPGALPTLDDGVLTVGTDSPAYPPWFVDDDPANGKGYESAVAEAVAKELGYGPKQKGKVTWTTVTFNNAIQPGPKPYDIDINQFSITDKRRKAVDFSSSYYDVRQTVIAMSGTEAAKATSIDDLKKVRLGAQVGTTSLDAIDAAIGPDTDPQVFNNNDDAKKALENEQIDALVADLPTSFYITGAELTDATIVGQLPPVEGGDEQFGLVLDKDSPLTECVTKAVDTLRENGTLADLEEKWLSEAADVPELS